MAAPLDWSQCSAVESVPGKRSGAWVFKGTRTPVSVAFENLQDMSVDELIEEFGVTREQVQSVLHFAARSREPRPSVAPLLLVYLRQRRPSNLGAVPDRPPHGNRSTNGQFLSAAESAGFEVLVTTDKNMRYQQDPQGRAIAIVALGVGRWSFVKAHVQRVVDAIGHPGSYTEVEIPWPPRETPDSVSSIIKS